ncbi:unnamed protein product [Aphanomyces euteiches]|nr:hypothetical protein AeRB84_006267 [Aphanomyces euteiches]
MPADLFTPIQVGALSLKNRIFVSPAFRGRTDLPNTPSALMKEYYTQRVSAGLIVSECNIVAPHTSAYTGEPALFTPEEIAAWKDITDAVHAKGGKIFAQLWHAGRRAHPDNNDGVQNVGPSPLAISGEVVTIKGTTQYTVPRELTVNEIAAIVDQFAATATNAIDGAGFDGVEIHAANGYLLDQFLRTSSNKRTDLYGGALENRSRFLAEVLQAVTVAVGADKVGVRYSPLSGYNDVYDEDPYALTEELAKVSQRYNVVYVHVLRNDLLGLQQGDVLPLFRKHFHNTLIGNSGYTKEEANAAIRDEIVNAVSFGQLYFANPDLVERFKQDAPLNTPDPQYFYTGGARGYIDYPTLQ